jgi:DNA-binding response OmpR family regulator
LIILNYEMPGLDALSFMTMLRVLMPNVPVIVLTRRGNVDIYLKVMSLGALEYMSEPFRISELRRVVQTACFGSGQQGLSRTCLY